MSKIIAVTGAGGYIGSVLVGRLLDAGYRVRALDRFYFGANTLDRYADRPALETRTIDIRDLTPRELEGCWGVIDLSGLSNDPSAEVDLRLTWEINEKGRIELARSAQKAGVERYVFSGSCSVYGAGGDEELGEDSELNPLTAYAQAAAKAEAAIRAMNRPGFTTVALRNALEWRLSGAARGKAALVIAADVALYAPTDPGEPTQGAGAVAMIVDAPTIAKVALDSYAWSEPAFDFWRPVGEAYPRVEGKLSVECYARATERCFAQLVEAEGKACLDGLRAACFHVPFPKMVKKATARLGETLGWDEARTSAFHEGRIEPFMRWNQHVGNAYTAGLWVSVACALADATPGDRIAAFSYGSGFGAELLMLEAGTRVAQAGVAGDFEQMMRSRRMLDAEAYVAYRERVVPAH